jgi:hypothetical protein
VSNGDLYFAADTDATGYELYKSVGGTGAPAQFIRTAEGGLGFGANGSNITSLKALGNEVFFAAYSNASRPCSSINYGSGACNVSWNPPTSSGGESLKIWRTNGSDAGTYTDPYLSANLIGEVNPIDFPSPDLNYIDYPRLMPVSSAAGESIYSVSPYGARDPLALADTSVDGFCSFGSGSQYSSSVLLGREVNVSFTPGGAKHNLASRPTNNAGGLQNRINFGT